MPDATKGAQRASAAPIRFLAALAIAAGLLALTAAPSFAATPGNLAEAAPLTTLPTAALAAATSTTHRAKVVVIVGPVGSQTHDYISSAKRLAALARSYGASVTELYSPNATWSRVVDAANGANLLIYLGHGNGSPSPYPTSQEFQNGLGLNASASGSNSNTRYYGETYIAADLHLAKDAVVIFNRLCYASGNNEWEMGNPTKSVAIERVDNYGQGFLKAGAAAVFAEGITDPAYIITSLFKTSRTMSQIFWASPTATHTYAFSFSSKKTPGDTAQMDPYAANRYYRSVIGDLGVSATDWR